MTDSTDLTTAGDHRSRSQGGEPFDPGDMLGAVAGLPGQLERTWADLRGLQLPSELHRPRAVLLAGMGGSAIAGDMVARLWSGVLRAPMLVERSYQLPGWVDGDTLVIASSFSGKTDETLAIYSQAVDRGARVVAVTSGGTLAERALEQGVFVAGLPPGGQPRAALGASLATVLGILHALDVLPSPESELSQAVAAMRDLVAEAGPGTDGGRPSDLAASLVGQFPVVCAPDDLGAVARRWKTQLNENAEVSAGWETLPELCHNTVVGFLRPDSWRQCAHFLFLTGPGTDERIGRRIQATAQIIEAAGIGSTTISAPALSRQAEALWLVQFGDLVSLYLAYEHGVDPSSVTAITQLKREVREA